MRPSICSSVRRSSGISDPGVTRAGARKCSSSQFSRVRSPRTPPQARCPGSRCPTRVRSGPSSPPTPPTLWQPRQPSEWNSAFASTSPGAPTRDDRNTSTACRSRSPSGANAARHGPVLARPCSVTWCAYQSARNPRAPTRERSGPSMPPSPPGRSVPPRPSTRWHARQSLRSNVSRPRARSAAFGTARWVWQVPQPRTGSDAAASAPASAPRRREPPRCRRAALARRGRSCSRRSLRRARPAGEGGAAGRRGRPSRRASCRRGRSRSDRRSRAGGSRPGAARPRTRPRPPGRAAISPRPARAATPRARSRTPRPSRGSRACRRSTTAGGACGSAWLVPRPVAGRPVERPVRAAEVDPDDREDDEATRRSR